MEHGICITYEFDGDEAEWDAATSSFIAAINADPQASGKFSYSVNRAKEGNACVHIGRWDSPETLAHVQAQEYFKTFAPKVQAFAGDTLKTTAFGQRNRTA